MYTTTDLIDLLAIVAHRGWRLVGKRVRDADNFCPICALFNEADPRIVEKELVYSALARANETPDMDTRKAICQVMCAADYSRGPHRAALLEALGLEEAT